MQFLLSSSRTAQWHVLKWPGRKPELRTYEYETAHPCQVHGLIQISYYYL